MTDIDDKDLYQAKTDRAIALDRRDRAKVELLAADRAWKLASRRVDRLLADRSAPERTPPFAFDGGAPTPNGLIELADLHARLRDPELTAAWIGEKEAERAEAPAAVEPAEAPTPGQDWGMWSVADRGGPETADLGVGSAGRASPVIREALERIPPSAFEPSESSAPVAGRRVDRAESSPPAPTGDPFGVAAKKQEAERSKRRERDARRKERERADTQTKAPPAAPKDPLSEFFDGPAREMGLISHQHYALGASAESSPPKLTTFDTTAGDGELRAHLEAIESAANADAAPTNVAANQLDGLDIELRHALLTRQTTPSGAEVAIGAWGYRAKVGATNADIFDELKDAWGDHVMAFVPPEKSGGRQGYAVRGWPTPQLWLGRYRGAVHKPDLYGSALTDRVRTLLQIPTPSAVVKASKGETLREPVPTPTAADRDPARKRRSSKKGRIPGALHPE